MKKVTGSQLHLPIFQKLRALCWKAGLCRIHNREQFFGAVDGKRGIEIGGPSPIFFPEGVLPLYSCMGSLDCCNFSTSTPWEGELVEGKNFKPIPELDSGYQYIREAGQLNGISSLAYDFVISSHCLEHLANPLKALLEWTRILKNGGHLLLILPDPACTFDHRRPVTLLSHLRNDFDRNTGEDDLSHVEEILKLHDLTMDRAAGSLDAFRKRSLDNLNNRCLHHHVFNHSLIHEMGTWAGLSIKRQDWAWPHHLITLFSKSYDPPDTSS